MPTDDAEQTWADVDTYLGTSLLAEDADMDGVLARIEAVGLPPISVSPCQGKFLHLLARMINARSILEIGTLGGYSTIWLARALPAGGRVVSLEINPDHAAAAMANLAAAGLSDRAEVRVGRAIDLLPIIAEEKRGPFDLIFVDADKPSNPDYFRWALRLSRPGSVIIVDNVVRHGAVADATSSDESTLGARRVIEMMQNEPRVSATALQTVGIKGYDGFAIALVVSGG